MACGVRIGGDPFRVLRVEYSGGYRFYVEGGGPRGWFAECRPRGLGVVECYARCEDVPRLYDVDELLERGPLRLDWSVLEHYKELLRGTGLEHLVEALMVAYRDGDVYRRVLEAVAATARGSSDRFEREVAAAIVWPLPCSGLTLENIVGKVKRVYTL